MQKTNAIPSGQLFQIDEINCMLMARILSPYKASPISPLLQVKSLADKLAFKVGFISICHNINWDFLQSTLAKHLLSDQTKDIPERLHKLSAEEFSEWMCNCDTPERVFAQERSQMLRAVGKTFMEAYNGDPLRLIAGGGSRLRGEDGFLKRMDAFEPYSLDPVKKKTNVLAHDLIREGVVNFVDQEEVDPAIDYHLIRLYLRSGRVVPHHYQTFEALSTTAPRIRASLITSLRKTVADGVRLTARFSGLSVPDINYIEWQIGRQVCKKGKPNCLAQTTASGLDPDVAKLFLGLCPYIDSCFGFKNQNWLTLSEPVLNKSYY